MLTCIITIGSIMLQVSELPVPCLSRMWTGWPDSATVELAEVPYGSAVTLFYTDWKSGPGEGVFMLCKRGLKPLLKKNKNKKYRDGWDLLCAGEPESSMTSSWPFVHLSWERPLWYIPLQLKMPIFQFQRSSSLLSILYDLAFVFCSLTLPNCFL